VRLLFLSNGHGEDAMGARLAGEFLALRPDLEVVAVPLVGRGLAYERAGIAVRGPCREMPSGGFMLTSPGVLVRDLRAGFAEMSREQYRAIRAARAEAVVVVGDVYALWASLRFAGPLGGGPPPVFQVQPLVSAYYQDGMTLRDRLNRLNRTTVDSFVLGERFLMRRARRVFVRDERSAVLLRSGGVPHAECAGNLMIDLVACPERDLAALPDGRPLLALLPGTREDYLYSLPLMLEASALLPEVQALAAFPGDWRRVRLPAGWRWDEPTAHEREAGAQITAMVPVGNRVPLLAGAFAAVLHAASVVLGTSGTGNEQAAGLGRPVVAFATHGPQYLPAFARAQQRLLGEALILAPAEPNALASAVRRALSPEQRALAERVGRERMGPPGAARRVAEAVLGDLGAPAGES
jgi:uncharacterized protein (TIGR03492 family)